MLRLLGQREHMAEVNLTEVAVFKKAEMLYQNLALWHYIVPKLSSVFMEHLYHISKINAQVGSFSRHQVYYPAIRAATKYSTFLKLTKAHLKVTTVARVTTTLLTDDITNSNFHNKHKSLLNLTSIFFVPSEEFSLYFTSPAQGKPLCSYLFWPSTWHTKQVKVLQSPFKRGLVFMTIVVALI